MEVFMFGVEISLALTLALAMLPKPQPTLSYTDAQRLGFSCGASPLISSIRLLPHATLVR